VVGRSTGSPGPWTGRGEFEGGVNHEAVQSGKRGDEIRRCPALVQDVLATARSA
jgi:hypothetical protein